MSTQLSDQQFNEIAARLKSQYVLVPRAWMFPLTAVAVVIFSATGWSVVNAIQSTASNQTIQLAVKEAKTGASKVQMLHEKAQTDSESLGNFTAFVGRVDKLEADNQVHLGSSADVGTLKAWRAQLTAALRALNARQNQVNKHVKAYIFAGQRDPQYEQQVTAFETVATRSELIDPE